MRPVPVSLRGIIACWVNEPHKGDVEVRCVEKESELLDYPLGRVI